MTARLICDRCSLPKETVAHYLLIRQFGPARDGSKLRYTKRRGSIDLCDDCLERTTHNGLDGTHKAVVRRRIEMGRTSR